MSGNDFDRSNQPSARPNEVRANAGSTASNLLARHPWLTYLLPFIVYGVVGTFEPQPPKLVGDASPTSQEDVGQPSEPGGPPPRTNESNEQPRATIEVENWFGLRYEHYALVYTVKIVLTIVSMFFVLPGYRQFPFRVSLLAIAVGVVGVVIWIALCQWRIEHKLLVLLGLGWLVDPGDRPAFNPLEVLAATPLWAYIFLGIRFIGLSLVVPVMEEFFLRGFLMRFVQQDKWWEVPFGTVTRLAVILGTAVPMLTHPRSELLAVVVWFSLVTWLMTRTRNIWDCVAAHAVTNFLLGVYVVTQHQWQLW